ncbi:MAG: hypothetical protein LQ350_008428, partial [Teloschistes chrysophthalmus]
AGTDFKAEGPIFETALYNILGRIIDPADGNRTLRQIWEEKQYRMAGLGSGSDFVAFLDLAGTSSLDMSFVGAPFPYHSCYDNFDWMDRFGDPGFHYHKALAQIWALLILDMADRPLLPFDFNVYAREISKYVTQLEKYIEDKKAPVDVQPLREAAREFVKSAKMFEAWGDAWTKAVTEAGGYESSATALERMGHNTRMANFETDLLDLEGGLPTRPQFHHTIFAPDLWDTYKPAYFPAVKDAVDAEEWESAQAAVRRAAERLARAGWGLVH